ATEAVETTSRAAPVPDASKSAQTALTMLTVETLPQEERRSTGGQVEVGARGIMGDPGFVPALTAITLGGIAFGASQFPYGRFATVGLGAIGVFFGVSALLIATRRALPGIGTAISGLALFLALVLPDWLGITSWRPVALPEENKMPRAVN